uniref:Ig-like domain-containing protein n=1 Tax=Mesocestoides corti TaxID=53468 RepID=A0A5K3EK45_MESCO
MFTCFGFTVVEMSKPVKLGDSGEALLRCTGYPSSSHERLEWAFKEADKDTVYLIGDQHLGDLTPSNRDRVSELLRCFRPGLNKTFASWPGSEFYNPQTNTTELYSPEEIDMLVLTKFTQDPACESVRGHLVCQYRRLNPLLPSLLQPEFVDFTRRSQHSNGTARAIISLEEIREFLEENPVQGSASQFGADPNAKESPYRLQMATCLLILLIEFCLI